MLDSHVRQAHRVDLWRARRAAGQVSQSHGRLHVSEMREKLRGLVRAGKAMEEEILIDLIVDTVKTGIGRLGGRPRLRQEESPEIPEKKRVIESTEPVRETAQPVSVGGKGGDLTSVSALVLTSPSSVVSDQTRVKTCSVVGLDVPAPSLFDELLGDFCDGWSATHGEEPYVVTGADRRQLGILLAAIRKNPATAFWSTQDARRELRRAFGNYFATTGKFDGEEKGHSLAWFCSSGGLNKYRAPPAVTLGLSDKGIQAKATLARFVKGGVK